MSNLQVKAIAPFITLGVLTLTALMGASYLIEQNGPAIPLDYLTEKEPALLYDGKPPWERSHHIIPLESLNKRQRLSGVAGEL